MLQGYSGLSVGFGTIHISSSSAMLGGSGCRIFYPSFLSSKGRALNRFSEAPDIFEPRSKVSTFHRHLPISDLPSFLQNTHRNLATRRCPELRHQESKQYLALEFWGTRGPGRCIGDTENSYKRPFSSRSTLCFQESCSRSFHPLVFPSLSSGQQRNNLTTLTIQIDTELN
jgi:hypothetical protein